MIDARSTFHSVTVDWDKATWNIPHCRWCQGIHSGFCPRVKCIEFHPNGTVKRVEFKEQP